MFFITFPQILDNLSCLLQWNRASLETFRRNIMNLFCAFKRKKKTVSVFLISCVFKQKCFIPLRSTNESHSSTNETCKLLPQWNFVWFQMYSW